MKKLIRLENTQFEFSSFKKEEVDKVLEFNPENGELRVHVLKEPIEIPFDVEPETKAKLLKKSLGKEFKLDEARILHNPLVKDAYSAPFKIFLDITTECHLQCPFCLAKIKDRTPPQFIYRFLLFEKSQKK